MVILPSTRGTVGSDNWFMCLAEKPMVRGYHLKDYDWTPLSQNPAQKCNDIFSVSSLGGNNICSSSICWLHWRSHLRWFLEDVDNAFSNHWNNSPIHCRHVKSLADDLVFCRGVVFSRAATLLRSIETKPFDWEICPPRMDYSQEGNNFTSIVNSIQMCWMFIKFDPKASWYIVN